MGGRKDVEKTGEKRPWKSQERFPLYHSFNNNKLDDRDDFQQNAKTSVASLRGLIGSSRNIDRHHSGMLIGFIGIPSHWTLPPFWYVLRFGSSPYRCLARSSQTRYQMCDYNAQIQQSGGMAAIPNRNAWPYSSSSGLYSFNLTMRRKNGYLSHRIHSVVEYGGHRGQI